ncbi:hypothetical protein KUTeg_008173 [Tegillarca granosa]|uniref:DUF3504 domain-containing protein n=1 Tax=Tegillarca granosa TaxID=220873 RepID=A0ABQ9F8E2_TEGGR|nr:hypothetical protein KUTeg_008173 [Tegillarca granosa]
MTIKKQHPLPGLDLEFGGWSPGRIIQKDWNEYEPDSLSAIQNSLDKYLSKKGYVTSIIRGDEFKASSTKRRKLKQEVKGRKPNRSEPVSSDEESVLWQKGILWSSTPEALQNAIWWRNNFFGLRGRDEHHKLKWGDITIESEERDTKTRKDPGHDRPLDPKLYETPETPTKRPVEVCQADSPFYIQIHPSYKQQHTWYKCQPMGVHSLGGMMKKMASDGCLQEDQSLRKKNNGQTFKRSICE